MTPVHIVVFIDKFIVWIFWFELPDLCSNKSPLRYQVLPRATMKRTNAMCSNEPGYEVYISGAMGYLCNVPTGTTICSCATAPWHRNKQRKTSHQIEESLRSEVGRLQDRERELVALCQEQQRTLTQYKREGDSHCSECEIDGTIRVVAVDELLYTQNGCSGKFSDGHTFDELIRQLLHGEVDPLYEKRLLLDVVQWGGKLWSVDNRRLYCLRKYQEIVGRSWVVHCRVRVKAWCLLLDRFWDHFDTTTGGKSIAVRCWR